jgi:hypothetical protein
MTFSKLGAFTAMVVDKSKNMFPSVQKEIVIIEPQHDSDRLTRQMKDSVCGFNVDVFRKDEVNFEFFKNTGEELCRRYIEGEVESDKLEASVAKIKKELGNGIAELEIRRRKMNAIYASLNELSFSSGLALDKHKKASIVNAQKNEEKINTLYVALSKQENIELGFLNQDNLVDGQIDKVALTDEEKTVIAALNNYSLLTTIESKFLQFSKMYQQIVAKQKLALSDKLLFDAMKNDRCFLEKGVFARVDACKELLLQLDASKKEI